MPRRWPPLQTLQRLSLDYAKVSSDGIASLASNANLRVLSLDNTDVDDEAIETLSGFADLTALNLYHTLVSESGVQSLRSALPDCKIAWERDSAQPTRRR